MGRAWRLIPSVQMLQLCSLGLQAGHRGLAQARGAGARPHGVHRDLGAVLLVLAGLQVAAIRAYVPTTIQRAG